MSVATRALSFIGKGREHSGMCERFTRTCFGFSAKYASAKLAYQASRAAGTIHTDTNPPAGVPVFWDITSGVNAPYDHVAVSVGGGYCVSTSAGPGRTVAKVKISDLTRRWGMRYLGWAEWYHGVRVYTPPKKVSQPTPAGNLTASVKAALSRMGLPPTIAGIAQYQRAHGLVPDGYWGKVTERYYKWVRAFQTYLNLISTVQPKLVVDGFYGAKTRNARRVGSKARGYNPPDEPPKRP